MKTLLHLCSDYPSTNVYRELISNIDKSGYNQIVYIPVKRKIDQGKRIDEILKNAKFIYSISFNNIDRLFYFKKVNKILRDVKSKINLKNVDFIHAHFLFSLGGIALMLKQEMGINYVVSIRNADVNIFFKYGFWLRKFALNIMMEASFIIFISPAYKKRVFENYIPQNLWQDINRKTLILPNGVHDLWLQNQNTFDKTLTDNEIRLIYVGELNSNKNIETSINVTKELVDRGYRATLKIIGKGSDEQNIVKLTKINKKYIQFYGYISDKSELMKIYSDSDIFIMPSFCETFGVVYIEAMSQGLPIIYTRHEGIDGYFSNGEVGYAVNPFSVVEIVERIKDICTNYEQISQRCIIESRNFSWDKIGEKYVTNILNPLELS